MIRAAEGWAEAQGGWTTDRHYSVPTTDVPLKARPARKHVRATTRAQPTRPAQDLPEVLPAFNRALHERLLPALSSRYPTAAPDASKLRVLDCFLVRYKAQRDQGDLSPRSLAERRASPWQAGAQSSLSKHSDQSLLSFTIALNDPSECDDTPSPYHPGRRIASANISAALVGTRAAARTSRASASPSTHPPLATRRARRDLAGTAPRSRRCSARASQVLFPGSLLHGASPITRGTRYIIVLFMGYDANRSGRPKGYTLRRIQELGPGALPPAAAAAVAHQHVDVPPARKDEL